jgi:hypothetical protein
MVGSRRVRVGALFHPWKRRHPGIPAGQMHVSAGRGRARVPCHEWNRGVVPSGAEGFADSSRYFRENKPPISPILALSLSKGTQMKKRMFIKIYFFTDKIDPSILLRVCRAFQPVDIYTVLHIIRIFSLSCLSSSLRSSAFSAHSALIHSIVYFAPFVVKIPLTRTSRRRPAPFRSPR